ncbi:hypothetical protein L5515_007272 [Caenorhabditis briggsae]|uniref:Uncharacterized protein n=1 Tax=Caenorhabditis briggsae TaxID=6238 RepID=A0AAE9F6J2_CAEBR|nr:hypothetical protein L5515_007272 [Caenorhabditis briggsae]
MDQTALIEMLKQKNEEIKKNIANQSSEHELKIETRKNAIQLIGKAHQQKMKDQNEELLEVCHEFPAESLASLKNQVTTFSTDLLNSRYFKEPAHTQLKEYCKMLHTFLLDCPHIAISHKTYSKEFWRQQSEALKLLTETGTKILNEHSVINSIVLL